MDWLISTLFMVGLKSFGEGREREGKKRGCEEMGDGQSRNGQPGRKYLRLCSQLHRRAIHTLKASVTK